MTRVPRTRRQHDQAHAQKQEHRLAALKNDEPPRSSARKWRTSGIVDKQSTLTQIDFVRRPGLSSIEDLGSDFDEEPTLLEPIQSSRKRKRIKDEPEGDRLLRRQSPQKVKREALQDKENDVFKIPVEERVTAQAFSTPRKPRNRVIPSSQSPTTPLSSKSGHRRVGVLVKSPLKEISGNHRRTPRLEVEDTFKTSDQSSSPLSTGNALLGASDKETASKEAADILKLLQRGARLPSSSNHKLEIFDSDDDLSDTELFTPSQPQDPALNFDDTTIMVEGDLPEVITGQSPSSEAEIMKLPVSDDSSTEPVENKGLPEAEESVLEDVNTLDDALLVKSRRTYSRRRRSVPDEIPSSSNLEELPQFLGSSPAPDNDSDPAVQVPSSPPLLARSSPSNTTNARPGPSMASQELSISSSAPHTDSQQAREQLQHESQWQAPIIDPSQATTASLQSSPVREPPQRTQSASARRGWFFNPLTDSQLLPDSIMNFELPKFQSLLGGPSAAAAAAQNDELEEL